MEAFSELSLKVWLGLLICYPLFYLGAFYLPAKNWFAKLGLVYVGAAQLTIGLSGLIILPLFWAAHLQANWIINFMTLSGSLLLGGVVFLTTLLSLTPFLPWRTNARPKVELA